MDFDILSAPASTGSGFPPIAAACSAASTSAPALEAGRRGNCADDTRPRPDWYATDEAQALLARCYDLLQIDPDAITLGEEFELTRVLTGKLDQCRCDRFNAFAKWSFSTLGADKDSKANDAFDTAMMSVDEAIATYRPAIREMAA